MNIGEYLKKDSAKPLLRLSTAGSVDDGKSTLIGRLLHDTQSILEDQLAAVRKSSKNFQGGEVDYSLLTDGLKAEREQGITIDVAYRYFSTPMKKYILADTPGHEQYTRNMATGASTAHVAVILVDARKGILTQTKRHSFIASLLGIKRFCIAVNKMDLVGYDPQVFERLMAEYRDFASKLSISDLQFFPISALKGDNVTSKSPNTPWFTGMSLLEYLDNLYIDADRNLVDLRFPVQFVVRGPNEERSYAGQISSGVIRRHDIVKVLPSEKETRVKSIVTYDGELEEAFAGMSVGVTLEHEIDISRGDMLVHPRNLPRTDKHFEAMLVWMNENQLDPARPYVIQQTSQTTKAIISRPEYLVNVNTLSRSHAETLRLNEIGRVTLACHRALAWDPYDKNHHTGSFIVVDPISNHTVGAGMIIDRLPSKALRTKAGEKTSTNVKSEETLITPDERRERFQQKGVTVWFT
ncbi:MAG TPA: sulfate adenylyltransferase subunit CysN, partial [Bdellovibrionales bacterium]|nr:sulfate adenylyltransferase subunit CysN [Bdellovibrionales bacterium]